MVAWIMLTPWAIHLIESWSYDYIKMSCSEGRCYGVLAVHRICFALALFHAALAAMLVGVHDTRVKRAAIQNGCVGLFAVVCLASPFAQLVGSQGPCMDRPRPPLFCYTEFLLHVLVSLCHLDRIGRLHPRRTRPLGRLCSFLVRDLPQQLGEQRLERMEIVRGLVLASAGAI